MNYQKYIFLFFLFCVQSVKALPLTDWARATAKVSSYPCLTELPRFEGTGLVFEKDHELYVVTSEHVVIHDKSAETCHFAGDASLELLSVDFYHGLALLRLKNRNAQLNSKSVTWSDLMNPKLSSLLVTLGFPVGDTGLVTLENGRLTNSESHRALIAGVPEMIEAAQLPVEYGMSGGLLLSVVNGDYAWSGMLSHQVLHREAGHPTQPIDVGPGSPNQNDLTLTIPAQHVINWIEAQLSLNSSSPIWERDPQSQVAAKDSVQYGSLLFCLQNKTAQDIWGIGGIAEGADGSGVGGSDGSGIGGDGSGIGGDGSGIGGDEDGGDSQETRENLQVIELSFRPNLSVGERSQPFADVYLEQWRTWLLSGKKVFLVFMKNPDSMRLARIQSLSQFLTLWKRDNYKPVALRSSSANSNLDIDVLLARASRVAKLAQAARDRTSVIEKKSWFGMIRDYAIATENALTDSQSVTGLLGGPNDKYWREYYDEEFDYAVELEAAIQSLITQMRKMGLQEKPLKRKRSALD